jgi:tetrapyrrole methylase family protein/MazG family protein
MDRFERAGLAFARLCQIMGQLRAPGGCAWDREQTLDTLKAYLIEEAYETLEAIERRDVKSHCEELGDLLLQVVFQAELTHEQKQFDIAAVCEKLTDKLIRRHPHVFGSDQADNAGEALTRWEAVKAKERDRATSALDGVPRALPGLLRALRTSEKAAAVGFDWPSVTGPREKVEEEWYELLDALKNPAEREEHIHELGDLLFAVVNLARHLNLDPEESLRHAVDRFQARFKFIERELAAQDRTPKQATLAEMDRLWSEAKSREFTPLKG